MKRNNLIEYDYFDKIDTEYKAYILGLIYADGCINDKVLGKREWRLQISIQEEDGLILQKLLDNTNKKQLVLRNPPSTIKNNWKKQLTACVNNTYLCKQLITLGCFPRKSTEGMIFPKLDPLLIPHFIRGFFDGDGCVMIKKSTYKGKKVTTVRHFLRVAFISTDSVFLDTLVSYLPINKVYKTNKLRKSIVHTYWIERKEDILNVRDYLYKDANYFFSRKYNKFYTSISSQATSTLVEGSETT
jgi:intein/homing endonuclease